MKKLLALLFAISLSANAAETLSSTTGAVLKTCDYDAGAICSLTWNGKQFINDYDHGRDMQSAVVFNNEGESNNPTEAGASYMTNGFNPHASSSMLISTGVSGGMIQTASYMAYWLPVNGVARSNILFQKKVRFGIDDAGTMPNVIQYEVTYTIPTSETYWAAQYEALTIYSPPEFSRFYTLDVKGGATNVIPLSDGPGEQSLPVIQATPDGAYAIGIYSSASPQATYPGAGYGRFRFPDVVKINNVFRFSNPTGTRRIKMCVVYGNMAVVIATMAALKNSNACAYLPPMGM